MNHSSTSRLAIKIALRFMIGIMSLAIFIPSGKAQAFCSTARVYNMTESATTNKAGYQEYTNANPPIIKYYLSLNYTYIFIDTYSAYNGSAYGNQYLYIHDSGSKDPHTGLESWNWTGNGNFTYFSNPDPVVISNAVVVAGCTNVTPIWNDGGYVAGKADDTYIGSYYTPPQYVTYATINMPALQDWSETIVPDNDAGVSYMYLHTPAALSNEYTDDMMRNIMIGGIPAFPADIPSNYMPGSGTAAYSINDAHTSCSGSRMRYQFWLCPQTSVLKGDVFELDWQETTTYPGTNAPTISNLSAQVIADGSTNGMYCAEHFVDVPSAPSSISESDASVTLQSSSPGGSGGMK